MNSQQLFLNSNIRQCSTLETIQRMKFKIDKVANTITIETDQCLNEIKVKSEVENNGYKLTIKMVVSN